VVVVAVLGVVTFLFVHNALVAPFPWINHDVALLTYLGFDILEGSKLYVDAYELNPPGSHFMQAAILALARAMSMSELLLSHLVVLVLGVAGLAVLHTTFRQADEDATFLLVVLAYLLVIVRANFSNSVLPSAPGVPYDFGQREHLFAILFVPYLLWSVSGKRAAAAVLPYLVILGYVASFKPYWPVLVIGVEAWWAVTHGRRRAPEYAALALGLALPFLVLLAHSPESFVVFFGELVPQVLGGSYSPYDMAFAAFVVTPYHVQMVSAAVLFGLCWLVSFRDRRVDRSALWLLLAVATATYLIMTHQHKFWSYHGAVYFGVIVVAGIWLLARIVGLALYGRRRVAAVGAVALVLLALLSISVAGLGRMLRRHLPKGHELVQVLEGAPGEVMFFSTAADYAYAPLLLHRATVGPWREHFSLPALLAIEDTDRRDRELEAYAEGVAERVREARPDLLLFAPYRHALPPGVSIHDVLMAHGGIPSDRYVPVPSRSIFGEDPRLTGWLAYRKARGD